MFNISRVTSGVQKFTQSTLGEAKKVKEKIQDTIVEIQTQDEIYYGSLWEPSEDVNSCRGCVKKIKTRKHHCRSCGGVFCDECCPGLNLNDFERNLLPTTLPIITGQTIRLCVGCRRGDCPSRIMKDKVKKVLDEERSSADSSNKHLDKVNAKVNEAMGALFNDDEDDDNAVILLRLLRGSFYGENGMSNMSGTRPPAVSGYFELYNKSDEVIAIKVIVSTLNVRAEVPRPSFIALPPRESMYGFFNKKTMIHLFLLFGNPNSISRESAMIYDTTAHGVHPEKISPCARIDNFQRVKVFKFNATEKNILLKYKGDGMMASRVGNAIGRVGLLGRLQGRRFAEGKLDYSTNVAGFDVVYVLQ